MADPTESEVTIMPNDDSSDSYHTARVADARQERRDGREAELHLEQLLLLGRMRKLLDAVTRLVESKTDAR